MIKATGSIVVARPISDVFAYVSDTSNQHDWQSGLHEITTSGKTTTEVRKVMGRRVSHVMELQDHVVNEKISHKGEATSHSGAISRTITFKQEGGSTQVSIEMDLDTKGALKAGEPVMHRMISREIRSDLEHLKDILESHHDLHEIHGALQKHGS